MSCPRVARLSRYRSNICQDNPCDFYRTNVYIPLLDVIITDISDRFGPHQRRTFALAGLIPAQLGQWTQIRAACDKYAAYLDTPAVVEGLSSACGKRSGQIPMILTECSVKQPSVHSMLVRQSSSQT